MRFPPLIKVLRASHNMKTEFRPVFKQEELELLDSKFLAKIICRQERDIHNLEQEVKAIMKEWKSTINLIK